MDLHQLLELFSEFLKTVHKDFDLIKILPKTSLNNDDSVFCGDKFIKLLERLISCLTDAQTKLIQEKQNKGENRNCGSTSNEESGDIAVKMELMEQENEGSILNTEHNSEAASQDPNSAKDITLRNNVQIKASSQEIDRRITAFIEQKRQEVDELNIREFCSVATPATDSDSSCARVDSVFDTRIGGKSHIKVTRVVNLQGPQTQVTQSDGTPVIKKEPVEDPEFSSGMEERLLNIETHLKLDKREQRVDLFSRVKKMEERILYLESLSPEYFSGGIPLPLSTKRKRTADNLPMKLQDMHNMDVADIEDRMQALRESLRRRAMNRL
ncbi:MAP3K12-binding inhibitory protein 1-like isoform X2 [Crassostrea virginica]